jgi:hypothetical protein
MSLFEGSGAVSADTQVVKLVLVPRRPKPEPSGLPGRYTIIAKACLPSVFREKLTLQPVR